MKKELASQIESQFNVSFASAVDLAECILAFKKYDKLPPATKDSLQVICDMYGLTLNFYEKKKAFVLAGINGHILNQSDEFSKWVKTASPCWLLPGANYVLSRI